MKYLWTEDTGAGLHFWHLVNRFFFDGEFIVESKESNQGILDAVYRTPHVRCGSEEYRKCHWRFQSEMMRSR